MRYLLDANAVIALLNDTTSPIARRIRRYAPRDVGVSSVVIHELYYGAFSLAAAESVSDPQGSRSQRRRPAAAFGAKISMIPMAPSMGWA